MLIDVRAHRSGVGKRIFIIWDRSKIYILLPLSYLTVQRVTLVAVLWLEPPSMSAFPQHQMTDLSIPGSPTTQKYIPKSSRTVILCFAYTLNLSSHSPSLAINELDFSIWEEWLTFRISIEHINYSCRYRANVHEYINPTS